MGLQPGSIGRVKDTLCDLLQAKRRLSRLEYEDRVIFIHADSSFLEFYLKIVQQFIQIRFQTSHQTIIHIYLTAVLKSIPNMTKKTQINGNNNFAIFFSILKEIYNP